LLPLRLSSKPFFIKPCPSGTGTLIFRGSRTPTLVVIGHRDLVFKQSAYDAVPDLIPGAQLAKIPVSAHLVQLERPDAVNRAINRFIGTVPGVVARRTRKRKSQLDQTASVVAPLRSRCAIHACLSLATPVPILGHFGAPASAHARACLL
jgi:hypothetical protein